MDGTKCYLQVPDCTAGKLYCKDTKPAGLTQLLGECLHNVTDCRASETNCANSCGGTWTKNAPITLLREKAKLGTLIPEKDKKLHNLYTEIPEKDKKLNELPI